MPEQQDYPRRQSEHDLAACIAESHALSGPGQGYEAQPCKRSLDHIPPQQAVAISNCKPPTAACAGPCPAGSLACLASDIVVAAAARDAVRQQHLCHGSQGRPAPHAAKAVVAAVG